MIELEEFLDNNQRLLTWLGKLLKLETDDGVWTGRKLVKTLQEIRIYSEEEIEEIEYNAYDRGVEDTSDY